jgi:hypothetical protein
VKVAQRSYDQYLQRQAYIVARHTGAIGRINEIKEFLRQHGR